MQKLSSVVPAIALGLAMFVVPAGALESALGTRILLENERGGSPREVSERRTFVDSERFRLAVNSHQSGYLYVLCHTSQGEARLLFPNAGGSNNRVDAGSRRTLPDRGWFRFDEEPGTERVFIIVSSRPIADLDDAAADGGEINAELLDRYTQVVPEASRNLNGARGIDVEPDSTFLLKALSLRHEQR